MHDFDDHDVPAPGRPPAPALLMLGGHLDQRDRMVVLDAALLAACVVAMAGTSAAVLVPALTTGFLALLVTRLVVAMRREAVPVRPAPRVAQVRGLDPLAVVPAIAVALTILVATARW